MSIAGRRAGSRGGLRSTAGVVLALTFAAMLVGAGDASAATNARLARVAGLHSGTVARHLPVHVVVHLAPGVTSFSARLDSTDVTRRFRRAGGRMRDAWVRPGPATGLRWGLNHLTVRTRRGGAEDFDAVRFWLARRSEGLVTRAARPHALPGQVPVGVRLTRRGTHLRVHLNGHKVTGVRAQGHRRTMVLDRDDGLRPGRNRLRILAYHHAGWADLDRRRFTVSRGRPVVGAGRDRQVAKGRRVRLRARAVVGMRPRGKLRYRWRITRRPHGSHARLRRPHSTRPRLSPDALGRYRVRLTVTRRARRGRRVRSVDDVTISSAPDVNPVGIPIDIGPTFPNGPWAVQLGAPDKTTYAPPDGDDPWQLLVLDRTTLAEQENESFTGGDTGTWELLGAVKALTNDDLVIISTSNTAAALDNGPYAAGNVNAALDQIQGGALPANAPLSTTGFAAVGIPGGGVATENPGHSLLGNDGKTGVPGELHGYLQVAVDPTKRETFNFVSGDYVSFDTQAPGTSPTQAAVRVGDTTYTSDELPAGTPGFYVVVLGSGTSGLVADQTFVANDPSALHHMDGFLDQYGGDGQPDPNALVIVQSIGTVSHLFPGTPSPWDAVAGDLQNLGGSSLLFDALGDGAPAGGYTQVGPGAPQAGGCCPSRLVKVAGSSYMGTAGRLTGLLGRDSRSELMPAKAGPNRGPRSELLQVVYQPTVPWPLRDTPAHNAAIACIAEALDLPPGPIERNYWTNLNDTWDTFQTTLAGWTYDTLPGGTRCQKGAFTSKDFAAVQKQLEKEFAYVWQIQDSFIPNLKDPLGASEAEVYANFQKVVATVYQSVDPPDQQAGGDDLEAIVADVLYIPGASLAAPSLAAGIITLADDLSESAQGDPGEPIEANAPDLADELAQHYEDAYDNLDLVGAMLVSDWGKLKAAYVATNGPWRVGPYASGKVAAALHTASSAWSYEQLVPLAYRFYDFSPDTHPPDFICVYGYQNTTPLAYQPFEGEPANGMLTVQMPGGPKVWWALGLNEWGYGHLPVPSEALVDQMFGGQAPPLSPLRLALRYPGPTTVYEDKQLFCSNASGRTRARSAGAARAPRRALRTVPPSGAMSGAGRAKRAARPAPARARPRGASSGRRR